MKVTRTTPIGSPVVADLAEYPSGYAWGETPTGETALGKLHGVEGDAGLCWCFVALASPGEGPAYRHVPMDRVRVIATKAEAEDAAIEWQAWVFADDRPSLSYGELAEWQSYFEELADEFGLTDEFRENGVI
jgi:hypothetical protein